MNTIIPGTIFFRRKSVSLPERHTLLRADQPIQSFPPQLTDIQLQTLDLLGVPVKSFLG
jgi:hypothetical protein